MTPWLRDQVLQADYFSLLTLLVPVALLALAWLACARANRTR